MVGRWWVRLVGLLAAVGVMAAEPVAAKAPSSSESPARIVAIGDLHGDHKAWRAIAEAAGLIDARGRWSGGATILVQAGDVPDRGPDSLKIILDLMRLQREAPRAGGRVVALVGNHEAMNMTGDLRYVSPGEYAAFVTGGSTDMREQVYRANRVAIEAAYRNTDEMMTSAAIRTAWFDATPLGALEHHAAWRPKGEIGKWVLGNPAILLLDGTLFVHGGISASYADRPIDELNRAVAAALLAGETAGTSILHDPLGPLWYRGLAGQEGAPAEIQSTLPSAPAAAASPSMPADAELDLVLKAHGAERMVIAHTPSLSGIRLLYGERLALIDTGISMAYGGQPSYLEIIAGRFIPHSVARSDPAPREAR